LLEIFPDFVGEESHVFPAACVQLSPKREITSVDLAGAFAGHGRRIGRPLSGESPLALTLLGRVAKLAGSAASAERDP